MKEWKPNDDELDEIIGSMAVARAIGLGHVRPDRNSFNEINQYLSKNGQGNVITINDPKQWIILNEQSLISTDKFFHNNNWFDMHRLLQLGNRFMPTLLESNQFDQLVYNGIDKKHFKVHYSDGTQVPIEELRRIFNERYEVRSPWRAEYLDAKFKQREDGLYLLTNHIVQQNGSLKPQTEELLEDTLMKYRSPGINLKEWIKDPNKHGLPKSNISRGSLYYMCPEDEKVAGLDAEFAGFGLYCNWFPSGSYGGLGARKILRRLSYEV